MLSEHSIIFKHQDLRPFDPRNLNHTYGVLLTYPETGINLHYEITCRFMRYTFDNEFVLMVNRQQVFVNGEIPSAKLYQLADRMAKAFYPMAFYVDNNSKKINGIANHPEIVSRCTETHQLINEHYEGDFATAITEQFYRQYSNPNILAERMENELFYKLYFFPLFGKYSTALTANAVWRIPFSTVEESLKINVLKSIDTLNSNDEKIIINLTSQGLAEPDGASNNSVNFEATYQLYADNHTIASIAGSAAQSIDGVKNRVEFEIYHLDAAQRVKQSLAQTQPAAAPVSARSLSAEPAQEPGKQSLWNIFD